MLKGLSKLSLDEIFKKIKKSIFDLRPGFTKEALTNAPIPKSTIDFLLKFPIPGDSNALSIGDFPVFNRTHPQHGSTQYFPRLSEWGWAHEFKKPFPEEILDSIVVGSASGVIINPDGSLAGYSDGAGGPICIKPDGSFVFYPEDDSYREYSVNSDAEKLLYCIVFFQIMAALCRRKSKKDLQFLHTVRPDYCDTIYEEMHNIDPKALENPYSFWALQLDLACFKHPLAHGRRRYPRSKKSD